MCRWRPWRLVVPEAVVALLLVVPEAVVALVVVPEAVVPVLVTGRV